MKAGFRSRTRHCRIAVMPVNDASTVAGRSLRPLAAGPVAQWLEPAAHNGLVAGSSPAGPTTLRPSGYAWRSHAGPEGRSVVSGVAERSESEDGRAKAGSLSLPTKISKTTPCKVAGGRWLGCLERSRENILTRRANQRHYSIIAQFARRPWPCPTTGSSARLQAKNPYPQLKLHRLARGA